MFYYKMYNSIIDSFKLKYLQRRFVNFIVKFSSLFNKLNRLSHPHINVKTTDLLYMNECGKHFDKLAEFIKLKPVIKIIRIMLKMYYRMLNFGNHSISYRMNSQMFLSMYIIGGFPEFILQTHHHNLITPRSRVDLAFDIYYSSKKCMDITLKLINQDAHLTNLIKEYNMYSNCFVLFINADSIDKTHELIDRWIELNDTIKEINNSKLYTEEQKEASIDELKKQQLKTEEYILKINSSFKLGKLEQIEKIKKELVKQYTNAFWNKLREELNDNNFSMLETLINEIKENLISFRPSNKDFALNINNKIQIDEIIKNIKIHHEKENKLINNFEFIVNTILFLQAPSRNNETLSLWNSIKASEKYYIQNSDIVIDILMFIYGTIYELKDDILNVYVIETFNNTLKEKKEENKDNNLMTSFYDDLLNEEINEDEIDLSED
jgi:hypothetical protein